MSVRVNRIWIDYDRVQKHHHMVFEHKKDVELVDLVSRIAAPDILVKANEFDVPIFNRDGNATLVREIGPFGIYYLCLRPRYSLTQIVVDPDDLFVDVTLVKDQLQYCFYNGTRRQSISITATIKEDIEGVARELSTGLNDAVWRQYFIRKVLKKPDARALGEMEETYPPIMTAAQVASYLAMEEKTIRNWTSEKKIPCKKLGGATRYKKTEIDAALDAGTIGKTSLKRNR